MTEFTLQKTECDECSGSGVVVEYSRRWCYRSESDQEDAHRYDCEECGGEGDVERLSAKEYAPLARRTIDTTLADRERLAMLLLGLIGECRESEDVSSPWNDDEEIAEAGDILWYLTLACEELGVDVVEMLTECTPCDAPSDNPCEDVKRFAFHGRGREMIDAWLNYAAFCVGEIAEGACVSVDHVRWKNIEKLASRYPEGFVMGGGER